MYAHLIDGSEIKWCLAVLAPYVTCVEHGSRPAALSRPAVLVADASPQSSSDTFPLCKQDKPNRFEPRQKPSARQALSGLHRNKCAAAASFVCLAISK